MPASTTMTTVQQVTATLTITDANGKPATLPSPPTWASSDHTLAIVTPAADGLSAVCTAAGNVGTVTITATGVNTDTPPKTLTDIGTIVITGASAESLVMAFGTPVTQTPATPPPPPPPAA